VTPTASEIGIRPPASGDVPLAELTPAIYDELRRIASRRLSAERRNHTLQPTALVHEAYLKLARERQPRFADEVHLLAVLSRVMRQVLVDYARARATQKRQANSLSGGTTVEIAGNSGPELVELIALDDALRALAAEDERLGRLVEMRYFGGMTAEESAEALDISVHIVRHDLRFAQAWLKKRLCF
jgi:RNA polymerase sigma factor (TIGR02999 family)